MKSWKLLPAVVVLCAAVVAADPPPPASSDLVIVDANGKELKLKTWKFGAGTRHLGWLAPPAPARDKDEKPDDKPAKPADAGPAALEFREDNTIPLRPGMLTLILPQHLRALEYDAEKQTVMASIAQGDKPDDDLKVAGPTGYVGINAVSIEAEVDKGEAGVAEVKYQGGTAKGVRAIRVASPRPAAPIKGRPAFVAIDYKKKKSAEELLDLEPLYRLADGGQRLLPTLPFKKTLKLDVNKIARLQAESQEGDDTTCRITTKDGEEQTYTLLRATTIDGKAATLEGLVGKFRGGYKLFPAEGWADMHLDVQFDEKKGEDKPEKP